MPVTKQPTIQFTSSSRNTHCLFVNLKLKITPYYNIYLIKNTQNKGGKGHIIEMFDLFNRVIAYSYPVISGNISTLQRGNFYDIRTAEWYGECIFSNTKKTYRMLYQRKHPDDDTKNSLAEYSKR